MKNNGKGVIAKYKTIAGITLISVAVAATVLLLPKALSGRTAQYEIVQLKNSIKAGATITSADVVVGKTSDKHIAEISVQKAAEAEGKVAARALAEGDYLMKSDIGSADSSVPEGKQIIAVTVSSVASEVGYQLIPGDIVTVYGVYADGVNKGKSYVPDELQYIKVADVYDANGVSKSAAASELPKAVTFYATPAQAAKLVELEKSGYIHFGLISRADENKANELLTAQDKLLKQLDEQKAKEAETK